MKNVKSFNELNENDKLNELGELNPIHYNELNTERNDMKTKAEKIEQQLRNNEINVREAQKQFFSLFGVNHCSHYYVFKNGGSNKFTKLSIGFLNKQDAIEHLEFEKLARGYFGLIIMKAPYNG